MKKKDILDIYNDELELIDNELHYEEEVNVDLLNDIGVENFCLNGKVFSSVDYQIGRVQGMKLILDLLEDDDV